MIKIFSGIFLLFYLLLCQANEVIDLAVNTNDKQFEVKLAGNATTGFQWSLISYDQNTFVLIKKQYVPSNPKLIGGGGQMIFLFSLKNGKKFPKQTTMKFNYARVWEHDSAQSQTINIIFK